MRMLYKFLTCAFVLLGCGALVHNANAVPAYPGPVTVTQPDGTTLTIRIYGDEFANYTTTDDGYGIKRAEDGFFYYIGASTVKARNSSARTAADRAAMSNVPMGVPWGEISAKREAAVTQRAAQASASAEGPKKALGTARTLILLVDFSNREFTMNDPGTYFGNFLNQDGFSSNGATGSVWNYYNDNSAGQFNPEFTASDIFHAPQANSWYAADDYRVPALVRSVLQSMYNNGFDFAPYATNGVVNDVFMIFAGNNQAEGGTGIWPHQWYVSVGGSNVIGGYTFNKYGCTSELRGSGNSSVAGIGTFTHEYGHILGLPDYYATNYATVVTPSSFFTMDSGSYNNNGRTPPSLSVINRYLLGWITTESGNLIELDTPGHYELPPINQNRGYLIRISGSGDTGEYFTLETRHSGNKWDNAMGSNRFGLFAMHIDRTPGTYLNRWSSNSVNDYAAHPCARPVKGVEGTSNYTSWVFPGAGNKVTLSETTHQWFKPWTSSVSHNYTLSNISYSTSSGVVSFDLEIGGVPTPDPIPFSGTVRNASNQNVTSGTVTLTRQTATTGTNSTTKLSPVSGAVFTAGISNGSFSFADVSEVGTYIATVSGTGYQMHRSVVNVTSNGTAALVVDNAIQSAYTRKSWAPSYNTSVKYTSGGDMIIGAMFDYADFNAGGKVAVYGADYHLSSTAGVELQVYDGNNTRLHSVPVSSIIAGNSKYADLTSLDLSLSEGESIVIAYKLTNYSGSYPAAMSSSTTNRNKGALIKSTETAQWSTGEANWMIGIYADELTATGVVFDNTSMDTYMGNVEHISYSFVPEGTSGTLTWRSSDTSVLTVDSVTGEIKCYKAGTATVTATLPNNGSATCRVNVSEEIDGGLSIEVNNSDKKAVVSWTPAVNRDTWILQWRPKGGTYTKVTTRETSVTLENLVWGTEYEVTVNGLRDDGRIWGETTGTFTSEEPSATGVTLTRTELDAFVGDMQALEYRMIPENGIANLNWSSSDTSVLTVDGEGVIKPLKAGEATVTVSSGDFTGTATCKVTVSSEIDGDVVIEVNNLDKSASAQWKAATTRPRWNYRLVIDGTQTEADQVTATEIQFTNLPAGARGELFISGVRSDGEIWGETSTTFQITDQPAAEMITLNPTEANIFLNEELQLRATVTPENAYNSEVEWSSSAPGIVSVDQNGLIKGEGNGEAIITVKTRLGDISATCAVTVTTEVAPVRAITVYQNDAEFEWPGSQYEGTFDVKIFSGNALVSQQTVETAYIYVPYLSPGTVYEIVVTAAREGGNSSILEFSTEARLGKFASMRDIKGSYTADELIPLRITNIQGDVSSIEWRVDSSAVTPPSVTLGTGRHEINATVTRKDGHKEVITKFVNIQ